MFVWKDENKRKEAEDGPFKKTHGQLIKKNIKQLLPFLVVHG